jgi:Zn finger protein HypA/HybF involved in hydrogenase expression
MSKRILKNVSGSIINLIPEEKFKQIVNEARSFNSIIKHFGFPRNGAILKKIKEKVSNLNLDIKHFNIRSLPKKNLTFEEIFIENSPHASSTAKTFILKNKLLEFQCKLCGQLPYWNNKPLNLQMDHINGCNKDHRLENLRFLCPNCHTQTPTFGRKLRTGNLFKIKRCRDCGVEMNTKKTVCRTCFLSIRKVSASNRKRKFFIDKESLEKLVWEIPTENVGKMYNVSGKAVEKLCKKFGITKPGRGYWAKLKSIS